MSPKIKVFVSKNCGPCHLVKDLIEQGKFNAEEIELLDLETDEGFAYIEKLGLTKVPSAYKDGQACNLAIDRKNNILILQCPGDEEEET